MGIPVRKPVLRNNGNSKRNDETPLKSYTPKKKSEFEKKKYISFNFQLKKGTYRKKAITKILIMFRDIDKKHNA